MLFDNSFCKDSSFHCASLWKLMMKVDNNMFDEKQNQEMYHNNAIRYDGISFVRDKTEFDKQWRCTSSIFIKDKSECHFAT